MGNWSEAWRKGDVDISLWPDYTPNGDSLERFRLQFMWEYQGWNQKDIPNWAWGHAVQVKIITPDEVPQGIPKDFDLPMLQQRWRDQKQRGLTTAFCLASRSAPVLRQRQESLMQAWQETPSMAEKGKGKDEGEKGKGKNEGEEDKGKNEAIPDRPDPDPAGFHPAS